jgi:putative ABC transport system permease protein
VTSAPGNPQLTVVGYAGSVVRDEDALVAPGQVAALRPNRAAAGEQMLYTFTNAGTAAQISADLAELKGVLPAGAVTGSVSWLAAADQTSSEQSVNTPFVVAFAVIGLVLAALIVASVVSGAVVAGYRRIGVLKSIGFAPSQVAATYVAQVGVPTLAGCLAGAALGNWWVLPALNTSANAFNVASQTVPLWINVTVPAGMCALVGLAALVPALRAGRLSAVQAIAAGQAPRAGHGYGAHRLALPRPVTIGLAAPFSRPAWSAVTLAAIMAGLTAVVIAVGPCASLAKINANSA